MSNTTMEEVFKAGYDAGRYDGGEHDCRMFEPTADKAWETYRYNQLLKAAGKEAADEWLAARHKPQTVIENLKCPDCDGVMVPRSSQYGKFWGCKSYPKCKGTRDSEGLSKAERAAQRHANSPEESMDVPVESGELYKFKKS